MGSAGGSDIKESACNTREPGFSPSIGKIPWSGEWLPTSILAWRIPWTEEPGGLQFPWGLKESDMTE